MTRQQQEHAFQREGGGVGWGEVERNSSSHSVHSIHQNTNKPNTTKVKKTNTKTHTNSVSTNQLTKPSSSPTTPNPRRDTPGEKGVGERVYGGRGKGNTTVKDTLNSALINARSLCNKKEEMVSYVYENTPDMVFVTDSWANENTMDNEFALNGYVIMRKDRKDRRGGGVLFYAKEEVSVQCDIGLSDCNEEILWCRLAKGNILAGVCYNSTCKKNKQQIISTLSRHAAEHQTKK